MTLKLLLPSQIFSEKKSVLRIVVETREASLGILPHRLDCVAALSPGILTYQTESEKDAYVAIDQGVLVKTGPDVLVSVRRAIQGNDLAKLRDSVHKDFLTLDEEEKRARAAMSKLEDGLLRRLARLQHD